MTTSKPKTGSRLRRRVRERAGVDRVDDGARVLEVHALAGAVGAAAPAGVHQPDARVVLLHLLGEQLGVLRRVPDQERPAEARRERRLRLGHAHLGARDLRRVAADEVVHRLRRRQPADRRQHAERVAGQEDHVRRMAGDARDLRVRMNSIGYAPRVFCVMHVSVKSTPCVVRS